MPLEDAMPPIININVEDADDLLEDDENGPHLFDLLPPLAYPPLPLHEVPTTDSDEFASPQSPDFTDEEGADDEFVNALNAPFAGMGEPWATPHMLDPILDVISRLEFEQYGGDDEYDDEETGFGHFPFPPMFNNVEPAHQLPQMWEVEDEVPPLVGGVEVAHGNEDDGQWETSSEEVVVGGDEEDLGKEVCHLSDTQDPNNALDDVAAAN